KTSGPNIIQNKRISYGPDLHLIKNALWRGRISLIPIPLGSNCFLISIVCCRLTFFNII
ncbi:hypothetical protein LCGC14_2935800, partial [marine sediment metagenome]